MAWTLELIDEARREILALPSDVRAHFAWIVDMLIEKGPAEIGMPYVRPLESGLWEMRLKGKDGIARALYFAASRQRLVVVRAFVKKTEKAPRREIDMALKRMRGFR